ncbi:MAG: VOC family protein [Tepidisphaeraceae bacterium]|jgi:catechol 2,3-dioxygenase-like lactoylglutathione lyase family enzyme
MFRRVDRVVLRVPNLKAAVKFYREALGLELLREESRLASLRMPDGQAEMILHCDPDLPAEAVYYFVDDVRALHARREQLGIQFTSPPVAGSRGYRAAIRDPGGHVLLIVDHALDAAPSAPATPVPPAEALSPGALFPGIQPQVNVDRELLVSAYVELGRTADDLPYTPDFERLYATVCAPHKHEKPTRENVWRTLLTVRKAGKLPKLGEARSRPPEVSEDERQWWVDHLGEEIGRRDRLPYSEKFERLVDEFNRGRRRALSPHLAWRLVATLAK